MRVGPRPILSMVAAAISVRSNHGGHGEGTEVTEVDDNELGELILGCALKVHKVLGPGLLESAYETCLAHELAKAGVSVDRQLTLPVVYDGVSIDAGYRIDLLVNGRVVVE